MLTSALHAAIVGGIALGSVLVILAFHVAGFTVGGAALALAAINSAATGRAGWAAMFVALVAVCALSAIHYRRCSQ